MEDVDGNVYVDTSSAFGVALQGHDPPYLRRVMASAELVHGMGDIHPSEQKLELMEALTGIVPFQAGRAVLATTGSEAVEIGLKSGALASGRPGILAFEGGYHGLTLGSLSANPRGHFRTPFESRLYPGVSFAPFPSGDASVSEVDAALSQIRALLKGGAGNGDPIGTVIVEPVQARGGVRVPATGFMSSLSELCEETGAVLVADEIFTGLGRCGAVVASDLVGLRPDIVCLGKSLGAGLPLSACIGKKEVMDAWPASTGEAIHTSTFLGHPLSCAVGTTAIRAMIEDDIPDQAERLGHEIRARLQDRFGTDRESIEIRGLGLLLGVAVGIDGRGRGNGVSATEALLRNGIIALPAGDVGDVLSLTPPVVLTDEQVDECVEQVARAVEDVRRPIRSA